MSRYSEGKEAARQEAKDWQADFENHSYSWEELVEWQDHFSRLAARYGLIEEFRENGIL